METYLDFVNMSRGNPTLMSVYNTSYIILIETNKMKYNNSRK